MRRGLDKGPLLAIYYVKFRNNLMTVTTNEHGQNNMWAVEPQMVVEDYNRRGLFSPWQQKEMYNGRWAMMGLIMGFVTYAINGKFFFGIF